MNQYTQEQMDDIKKRSEEADKDIKAILDAHQLAVKALPAFQEIEGGKCVAVGILQYQDLKYSQKPVLETDSAPEQAAPDVAA